MNIHLAVVLWYFLEEIDKCFDICEYLDHIYAELDQIGMEHKMNKAAEKATISCGFTIFQNDDLFRYEDALTMADAALYKAKAAGKNQYKQY